MSSTSDDCTAEQTLSENKKDLVKEFYNHECQLCGRYAEPEFSEERPEYQEEPVELHVHHKVPLSEGGTNEITNLVTICKLDHARHHNTPAPETGTEDSAGPAASQAQVRDLSSVEADIYRELAQNGPSRTGRIASHIGCSKEHTRRQLYALGAKDRVMPTDGGWDIAERVSDPPIGELPETTHTAAVRTRDEVLRRAADYGLEIGEIAEIADLSPHTVRKAIDRAATYRVPLPTDDSDPDSDDNEQPTVHDWDESSPPNPAETD